MELSNANSQVCLIELVRDVPSEGSKLSPLLYYAMEKAQSIQQLLEGRLNKSTGKVDYHTEQRQFIVLIQQGNHEKMNHCNETIKFLWDQRLTNGNIVNNGSLLWLKNKK